MYKFSKQFVSAVNATWQAIASDLIDACGELDNFEAVESCIDADRIVMYGGENGKAAQDEFRARVAAVGYVPALREVCDSLPYPLM